uniref:RING finger protein 10 n=1 Tax=Aegilops tauschii TaxID=37682 RepID=R7WED6_AEGTA
MAAWGSKQHCSSSSTAGNQSQKRGHSRPPCHRESRLGETLAAASSPGSGSGKSRRRRVSAVAASSPGDCGGGWSKAVFCIAGGGGTLEPARCLVFYRAVIGLLSPSRVQTISGRVTGKILELETITQSEASRKRYRFLSHFSLTTTFQFCEIDLSDMLPPASLAPFMDEIKRREKQRIQTAKKEEKDRVKAEVAAAAQESAMRFEYTNFSRTQSDVMFSLDDFEALGNNAAGPSTSPPAGERKLFSDVTRLGFASALGSPPLRAETGDTNNEITRDQGTPHHNQVFLHMAGSSVFRVLCQHPIFYSLDSPPLRAETGDTNNEITRDQGPVAASSVSFASILSSTRASADSSAEMPKPNGVGKAGKKRTKVLLSTGGGRRY